MNLEIEDPDFYNEFCIYCDGKINADDCEECYKKNKEARSKC